LNPSAGPTSPADSSSSSRRAARAYRP
jgi:hypothetical protein